MVRVYSNEIRKHQIPSTKRITNLKSQKMVYIHVFEIWNLRFFWNLGFGAWNFSRTQGYLKMLESKVFANGSTTLPKIVRDALGVEASDTVRYVLSEKGAQVLRTRSVCELAGMLARDEQATVSLSNMENAIIEGAVESGKCLKDSSIL